MTASKPSRWKPKSEENSDCSITANNTSSQTLKSVTSKKTPVGLRPGGSPEHSDSERPNLDSIEEFPPLSSRSTVTQQVQLENLVPDQASHRSDSSTPSQYSSDKSIQLTEEQPSDFHVKKLSYSESPSDESKAKQNLWISSFQFWNLNTKEEVDQEEFTKKPSPTNESHSLGGLLSPSREEFLEKSDDSIR